MTERYILLKEGESEALLTHELAHYYALKDPLGKLPFMIQEGLACLVSWDVAGATRYPLRLPSELAIQLALTATREEAQSWMVGSELHNEVSLAACWICAMVGLENLQTICANAPGGDPESIVKAICEHLPSLKNEPRRGTFEIERF